MAWWVVALLYTVFGAAALWILIAAVRTRKPIRSLLKSTVQGASALAAVNVAGAFTGVSLGINWLSGVVCVSLGVPGVITLLLLKVIFGI